jgi:hypothetical protein
MHVHIKHLSLADRYHHTPILCTSRELQFDQDGMIICEEMAAQVRIRERTGADCLRPLQHWHRGFESHLGMDVCVCSVCVLYELKLLIKKT